MKKNQTFLQRNSVTIVMIPALIGIHYVWSVMQKNRTLVTTEEEIDLPIVTFAKFCWRSVQGATGNEQSDKNRSTSAVATAAAK